MRPTVPVSSQPHHGRPWQPTNHQHAASATTSAHFRRCLHLHPPPARAQPATTHPTPATPLRPPPQRPPSTPSARCLAARQPHAPPRQSRERARCCSGVLASDGARGWTAAGYRGWTALRAGHGWSHRLTVSASATRGIRRAVDRIRRQGGLFNEHAAIFFAIKREVCWTLLASSLVGGIRCRGWHPLPQAGTRPRRLAAPRPLGRRC